MNVKDVFKYFKSAPWGSLQEVQAFAEQAEQHTPADIAKLLAVVIEKHRGRAEEHKLRCVALKALTARSPSPQHFVPFARALTTPDPTLLALMVELLPLYNDVSRHAVLCEVLGETDSDARAAAATVLKQIAGPQALEALTKLVGAEDFHGRSEAIGAIVPRAKHRALPMLLAIASRGDPRERAEAYRAAGDRAVMEKDLPGASEFAARGLNDPHDRVVAEALKSLAQVAEEQAFFDLAFRFSDSSKPIVRQAFVEALRAYSSQRVINLLARIRRRAPPFIRNMVIESLEIIGTDDVLPVLVECIADKQVPIRTRAADALVTLSKNGKVELARTITWLLRSRDVNVRRLAVEIARRVGDSTDLVPSLLRFLRDEDWWVRERVMDALIAISGKRVTEHLVGYLEDPSDVVRRFAVNSLRRLKDPRSLGALVRVARNDADWWIREDAILTVGDLGDERAVPYVAKLMRSDPEVALPCVQALHKLLSKESCDLVAESVAAASPGFDSSAVRLAAVRYLMDLGEPRHAAAFVPCESDDDIAVRDAVEAARAKWSVSSEAVSTVTGMLTPLDQMLVKMAEIGADDLIVSSQRVPMIKLLGKMKPLSERVFPAKDVEAMLHPILSKDHRKQIESLAEVDCSHQVKSHDLRFRVNLFKQLTGLGAVFRIVKNTIPNIDDLNLPPLVKGFGDLKNGLVLVGGPTGAGKSTTLAALIDHINRTSARHIVSIEDPIEVVHQAHESLINQREVGTHTLDFESALRSTVRQDPDVILVGELRDLATISFAVTAAETGHLVFGTVHTVSVDTSIDRILNSFPPAQRPQIRSMLSETLRAVLCQHLLRRKDDPTKRVLAVELMLNTPAIANLIRKDKAFQIPAVLTTHRDVGMQSMDQHLVDLVKGDMVTYEEAQMRAQDKKQFELLIKAEALGDHDGPSAPKPGVAPGTEARFGGKTVQ